MTPFDARGSSPGPQGYESYTFLCGYVTSHTLSYVAMLPVIHFPMWFCYESYTFLCVYDQLYLTGHLSTLNTCLFNPFPHNDTF